MKKINWRFYAPGDEAAVKAMHLQMEAKVGTPLDLPDMLDLPVLVSLVGETDGVITHGVFLELEAEVCAIGSNPLPPEQLREAEAYLLAVLDRRILEFMRLVKPMVRKVPALRRVLEGMGFTREDSSLMTQFYRWTADGGPAEVETKDSGESKS